MTIAHARLRTLLGRWGGSAATAVPPEQTHAAGEIAPPLALSVPTPMPAASEPTPEEIGIWPVDRIAVNETVWGEGFLLPGGSGELLHLVRPLGMSKEAVLLLLGAGIGGPGRTVAKAYGASVDAFESEPQLVAVARARGRIDEFARRSPVAPWTPTAPSFRPGRYMFAMASDVLSAAPPHVVLPALATAMPAGGQLVVLQTVADKPLDPADPDVAAWAQRAPHPTTLPSEARVTNVLARAGFDVRVVEDLSERHASHVLAGWRAAEAELSTKRPSLPRLRVMVSEAELWLHRLRLLQAGSLRMLRWHSIRTITLATAAPTPPGKTH